MRTKEPVAVYGAAGHTGRFVVAELRRRGWPVIAVARRAEALSAALFDEPAVTRRAAGPEDAAALAAAFSGAAAVINCAGPFLDTAQAIAAAALAAGAHYLDVTAEQASAQATLETFDAPARAAGKVVMPAMAFYGGFGDLLVTAAMGAWREADEVRLGIALDSWRPTEGTRRTGARNTFRRQVIAGGRLAAIAEDAPGTRWTFPPPFGEMEMAAVPFSEVNLIHRHLTVGRLDTFLAGRALADIRDPATPPPEAADDSGRSAQRFTVEAVARRGGETRRARAAGRDIYGFTGPLVVEAAARVIAGQAGPGGAVAPGQALDAVAFLRALPLEALDIGIMAGAD